MYSMDCECAREALLDAHHGRLPPGQVEALRGHLQACRACASEDARDRWLGLLLRGALRRPVAPPALRARVRARLAAVSQPSAAIVGLWLAAGLAALATAVLVLAAWPRSEDEVASPQPVLREALNDHLRVVYAQDPIEIDSHRRWSLTPWFTGRLDFAPDLAFVGDGEFALQGGAVGYFIDRKAATLVFKRRQHTISCFVFRAQGLPWPRGARKALAGGRVFAQVHSLDGFHLVLWRDADLGHALVSDARVPDLLRLGARLADASWH